MIVSELSGGVWHRSSSQVALLKSANEAVLIHFNDVHFGKGKFILGGRTNTRPFFEVSLDESKIAGCLLCANVSVQ